MLKSDRSDDNRRNYNCRIELKRKVSVPFGTTILEACRDNQIHIPTLCHHDDLCVAGVCRVCVVEVEGMKTLQASCAFPITSPIKVKTSTSMYAKQEAYIDLMLSEHYGECYSCIRNNNCELQSLAEEYGVDVLHSDTLQTQV